MPRQADRAGTAKDTAPDPVPVGITGGPPNAVFFPVAGGGERPVEAFVSDVALFAHCPRFVLAAAAGDGEEQFAVHTSACGSGPVGCGHGFGFSSTLLWVMVSAAARRRGTLNPTSVNCGTCPRTYHAGGVVRAMTLPIFTEGSPRVLGIVLAASCHLGVCDIRHDFDRAQFWYPQQVWDDLYGTPWTVELAGERWFQNLSRWDPTIKREAGDK